MGLHEKKKKTEMIRIPYLGSIAAEGGNRKKVVVSKSASKRALASA